MTYEVGDRVYILHEGNGRFHHGVVTAITPTGRINVHSKAFSFYHGQFNQDGTLRGHNWHGGSHLVPNTTTTKEHNDYD